MSETPTPLNHQAQFDKLSVRDALFIVHWRAISGEFDRESFWHEPGDYPDGFLDWIEARQAEAMAIVDALIDDLDDLEGHHG